MKKIYFSMTLIWIGVLLISKCNYHLRELPQNVLYFVSFLLIYRLLFKLGFNVIDSLCQKLSSISWLETLLKIIHLIGMSYLACIAFIFFTFIFSESNERILHENEQTYLVRRTTIGFHHVTVTDNYYIYKGPLLYYGSPIKEVVVERW